jgi:hypothetical protein
MAVTLALLIVTVILLVIILIISAVILSNQTQSVVNGILPPGSTPFAGLAVNSFPQKSMVVRSNNPTTNLGNIRVTSNGCSMGCNPELNPNSGKNVCVCPNGPRT